MCKIKDDGIANEERLSESFIGLFKKKNFHCFAPRRENYELYTKIHTALSRSVLSFGDSFLGNLNRTINFGLVEVTSSS